MFEGREGHAGTTPMQQRDDALVAAAELVLRLRDAAANVDGAVATVGRLSVEPGASNVIPARVVLSVDVRAPDDERLEQVAAVVPGELSAHATRWRCHRRLGRRCSSSWRPRSGPGRARFGRGPRRRRAGGGGRADGDALRPQPERRDQPLARRALGRRTTSSWRWTCWPEHCERSPTLWTTSHRSRHVAVTDTRGLPSYAHSGWRVDDHFPTHRRVGCGFSEA